MTNKRIYIISGSLFLLAIASWFGIKWWQLKKDVQKEKEEGATEEITGNTIGEFNYNKTDKPGTQHFSIDEYNSHDGVEVPEELYGNVQKLMEQMEIVRAECDNTPLRIHSGYRSPAHNAEVGGVAASQHPLGTANDFSSDKYSPAQLKQILERLIAEGKILQGGIGLYPTFVHYDIRGNNARWTG